MRIVFALMILSLAGCRSKGDDKDGDGEVESSPSPPGNRDTPDDGGGKTVEEVVVTETNEGQQVILVMDDGSEEIIYQEVSDGQENIQDPDDLREVDIVDTEDGEGDGSGGSDPSPGQVDGGSDSGVETCHRPNERASPVAKGLADRRCEEELLQSVQVLEPKPKKNKDKEK